VLWVAGVLFLTAGFCKGAYIPVVSFFLAYFVPLVQSVLRENERLNDTAKAVKYSVKATDAMSCCT